MSILIVGHGLAGATLAYQLYKKGVDFTIVSGNKPTASRVAAGMINPIVFRRLNKSWAVEECLPLMHTFYKELERDLQSEFYYNVAISKLLSQEEFDFWTNKISEDNSLTSYLADPSDAISERGLKPFYGSGIVNKGGYVDLNVMLDTLQQKWKALDCFIEATINYDDFVASANSCIWKGKEYTKVVFCEGVGVTDNPFFDLEMMKPVKGELLTIYSEGLPQDKILNKNMFVLPVGNHYFKVGATYNWQDLSERNTNEALEELKLKLEKIIDVPYKVVNQHAGVRPTVKDRRPILGYNKHFRSVAIFNGLGAKGVMLAPYFSALMVDSILNLANVPNEVDVKRFEK
ncbi:NAD(P)/FAD-dependent oxidoreductase [Saccharicrinis aurantiacus]|uniref:NAD(P)/FAD-dependent oxidoreductase n=1 Tax=Saccharicrinis aurantiacus TaxID=1849719 RepID=UPI0008384743|nr:FAD-dependent oxidoreductase [Saccharicrinis aurantiacus]